MKKLSSIELNYLVKEMSLLIGSKVDKIYDIEDEIVISLHLPNTGKKFLRIVPGKFLFLTDYKESAENPSGFAMNLRKYLSNARIREIKQVVPERIIEIIFEKEERFRLYIEMFSNGNVILTDDKQDIISAQLMKSWKDRTIKAKLKYDYPKSRHDIFSITQEKLLEIFSSTQKDKLVTSLAMDLGAGGVFSEEICMLSKIDKNKSPKEIDSHDAKKIFDSVKSILSKKISPLAYMENESITDIVPFPLETYENLDGKGVKEFGSYSSSLEFYYNEFYVKEKNKDSRSEREIRKILSQIKSQEESIVEIEDKISV